MWYSSNEDMFYRKIPSYYSDYTRVSTSVLLCFICTSSFPNKKKKHTKRHVLESTNCLELLILTPFPESSEYSLSLNDSSEGK